MTVGEAAGNRVLVVDDEPQIRRLLSVSLSQHGYHVEEVATGEEGMEKLTIGHFDILLLDLGLTDMDGLDVCRQVRQWSQIPIIVISVREEERDKVSALDLGADDYITKPFSTQELLARVRANLRRVAVGAEEPVLNVGPLTVDLPRRHVLVNTLEVHLTPTEYDLLRELVVHAGKVLTHRHLLRATRGPTYEEETSLLRVHMVGLRQKLKISANTPGYIATEPGVGYRLLDETHP